MNNKTNKFLISVATACFVICFLQGMCYYVDGNLYTRLLQSILNVVRAFLLEAEISMQEIVDMLASVGGGAQVLGYLYISALLVAPLCTAAAVLVALRRIFYGIFAGLHNLRAPRAVVFGDSPWGRSMLTAAAKTHRTVCFVSDDLPGEVEFALLKAGVRIVPEDPEQRDRQFKKYSLAGAEYIALMAAQETDNLAALHRVAEYLKNVDWSVEKAENQNTVCLMLYESYEVAEIARSYCDDLNRQYPALRDHFELVPLNIAGQTVSEMLRTKPIYSYNIKDPALARWDPTAPAGRNPWNVHQVIAGFGLVGQQMLMQSINMSVMHADADITIDVFDKNVQMQLDRFMRQFAVGTYAKLKRDRKFGDTTAAAVLTLPQAGSMDGSLTLRFFDVNVAGASFEQALQDVSANDPITYAAVCFGDSALAISTALALDETLQRQNCPNTPINIYMDRDDGLRQTLESANWAYAKLCISCEEMTPEKLAALARDTYAIGFNGHYNQFDMYSKENRQWDGHPVSDETAMEMWKKKPVVDHESSRKSSAHQSVKVMVAAYYEWLHDECRDKPADHEPEPFESYLARYLKDNETPETRHRMPAFFRPHIEKLHPIMDDDEMAAAITDDPLLHALTTLEHRRWNHAQLTMGFAYAAKKDKEARLHDCILSWADLCKKRPDTCIYDLIPVLMLDQ